MMERLNDIMGRAVQRRPAQYGYNEQRHVPQGLQQQRQPKQPSEAVTRHLQPEPEAYSPQHTPRQSRPLHEQMGRSNYDGRANNAGSASHTGQAGQTGRIESSERLGRVPASQAYAPQVSRPAPEEQSSARSSSTPNTPGSFYGRERHSIPAVPRQPTMNPSSESRTHQLRPNPQRYSENTNNLSNSGNGNMRAYQPQRSNSPLSSPQDEAYHPLKTRPIPAQLPGEDYTVSPRPHADSIDTWENEERATGMQYGDWEGDEQEIVVYQRPTTPYREQATNTIQGIQEQDTSYSSYPQHPYVTRNLHEVHIQEVAATYPAQSSQPSYPTHPTHPTQHPSLEPAGERYHRMTQPLDPRLTRGLGNEERTGQRAVTDEYADKAHYDNYHDNYQTPQDASVVPPTQHRPIRSLSQVTPQPKEVSHMAPTSVPASNALAPVSQSARQVCRKCGGAGYLRADVPFGHPNFGKPIACVCKEAERKEKRRQQLRDMSNMDAFRDSNFRTFNPRIQGVQEAFQVTREFAQDPDGWLLLIGPNGCGKTHLAAAIANQSLDSGSVVLFAVVPDLLDHLRAAFAPTAKEVYDQLFSKMREAELLVLDDLGAQQSSPWANEKLFQLLNYRYNMGMPTVITANPKGLQGVDERIRSRLCDVSLVTTLLMDRARDYRPIHPRRDM